MNIGIVQITSNVRFCHSKNKHFKIETVTSFLAYVQKRL